MTNQEIIEQSRKDLKAIYKQAKEKLNSITPIVVVVGKWYKDPFSNYLVHVTKILGSHNYVEVYGFDSNGNWFNKWDTTICQLYTEATPQEVEQSLIEEAKSRGHAYSEYDYNPEENELCGINNGRLESVFCDGHWEQPIDKFAELKEAHKKGAVIQSKVVFVDEPSVWEDVPNPIWNPKIEYRIKPEEKPKVGDLVKAWNEDSGCVIGIVKKIEYCSKDTFGYTLNGSVTELFMNAKTLAQQEAIDLLFGKEDLK